MKILQKRVKLITFERLRGSCADHLLHYIKMRVYTLINDIIACTLHYIHYPIFRSENVDDVFIRKIFFIFLISRPLESTNQ